ncbi:hypothetical protein LTR05_008510 [Lithohypha guttulata]|uniref:Uncharacterized protein n=1 Tax=Lithohypha guttulata TaxID=1690604 RepID=A0AAN7PS83_9EURO|nr:hypothetical protein LTR05_008510 [Lithohypha guttulata]
MPQVEQSSAEDPLHGYESQIQQKPLVTTDDPEATLSDTIRLAHNVISGLDAYAKILQKDLVEDLIPSIVTYEIRRLQRLQVVIEMKIDRLMRMRDAMAKQAQANLSHERWIFKNGKWAVKTADQYPCETDVLYIQRARAYLIDCHVLYKINFALCR